MSNTLGMTGADYQIVLQNDKGVSINEDVPDDLLT